MKTITGNLIDLTLAGEFDVIVHQCNLYHTFGSGIAKEIRLRIPQAYEADCKTSKGDISKMGTYSLCIVPNNIGGDFVVVNAYAQSAYGYDGRQYTDYEALRKIFKRIKQDFTKLKIGYPLIGCGLGGGNWDTVSKIINEELVDEDHTLVLFKP